MAVPFKPIDDRLKEFGTERDALFIDTANRLLSFGKAAAELGLKSPSNITDRIRILKLRAATAGYSPEHDLTKAIAPGYVGRGHSTLYNKHGEAVLQWVKTRADDQARQEALDAAAEALAETLPRLAPVAPPPPSASRLLNLFTLTDCHVGMLAWHREGGADWDLGIAEDTLVRAFEHMIASAPRARVAVVSQLGDFLHFDSLEAVTPTNRHALDADGRFRKIIQTAIRILRRVIDMALATHDEVHVIMAEGNHDIASSAWLQVMFAALYEDEPRVTVNDSAIPFYAYRFGKVMLAFHHGHTKRKGSLPLFFATEWPEMWGSTRLRVCHTGHEHHTDEKEAAGMTVIQHPTLAARDAYAARHGYQALRRAVRITYHEDGAEASRASVYPELI